MEVERHGHSQVLPRTRYIRYGPGRWPEFVCWATGSAKLALERRVRRTYGPTPGTRRGPDGERARHWTQDQRIREIGRYSAGSGGPNPVG